jgi:hypothetical protein
METKRYQSGTSLQRTAKEEIPDKMFNNLKKLTMDTLRFLLYNIPKV